MLKQELGKGLVPGMGFNSTGTRVQIMQNGMAQVPSSAQTRVHYTPASTFTTKESAIIFTFSAEGGVKIYVDGVLAASAASTYVINKAFGAGEYEVLGYARKVRGHRYCEC